MAAGDRKQALAQFDSALTNGFSDFDLLNNPSLKSSHVLAEFKLQASHFRPSNDFHDRQDRLKAVLARGTATSSDEEVLVGNRMREISVEPSKQQEYRKLLGISFRGTADSDSSLK